MVLHNLHICFVLDSPEELTKNYLKFFPFLIISKSIRFVFVLVVCFILFVSFDF